MKVKILAVGKTGEKFWSDAVAEYSKRLSRFCNFTIEEIPDLKNPDLSSTELCRKTIEKEGESILRRIKDEVVVALCIEGKQMKSEDLCSLIEDAAMKNGRLTFVIGGSLGLSDAVKNRADFRLSMSKMIFPHALARVMLAEQIYRAYTIMNNGNYHK